MSATRVNRMIAQKSDIVNKKSCKNKKILTIVLLRSIMFASKRKEGPPMSEKDKKIAESIKSLLPRLSYQDKRVLMAYGEGMADRAARDIVTHDSAPEPRPQK